MNKERLNNIIKGNLQLTQEDLEEIKSLTDEFPFCQIGHVLSAVAHKQHEHMLSEDKIMTAALHTGNRKNLRALLNRNGVLVKKDDKQAIELAPVNLITTVEEEKEVEVEINSTISLKTEKPSIPHLLSERRKDISKELEENLTLLQNRRHKKEEIQTNENELVIPPPTEELLVETPPKEEKTILGNKKTTEKQPSQHITSSRMGDEVSQPTNTSGSFTDIMLQYLETLEEQRSNKPTKEDQLLIIEDFIQKDPNISRSTPSDKKEASTDLAKDSVRPKNKFISENLAKINAKQGNISNAIDIYEQLMLKYPEKKSYFAEEIEKLKQS